MYKPSIAGTFIGRRVTNRMYETNRLLGVNLAVSEAQAANVFGHLFDGGADAEQCDFTQRVDNTIGEITQDNGEEMLSSCKNSRLTSSVATQRVVNAVSALQQLDEERQKVERSRPRKPITQERKRVKLEELDRRREEMVESIARGLKNLDDIKDLEEGMGWDKSPPENTEQENDRINLAKEMSSLLPLIGRVREAMKGAATVSDGEMAPKADTTIGSDLSRLTMMQASELTTAPKLFELKMAQRKLELQVKEGSRPMGRGDVHVLLDISGSMRSQLTPSPEDYTRQQVAKCLSIATVQLGIQLNRKVRVTPFNTCCQWSYAYSKKQGRRRRLWFGHLCPPKTVSGRETPLLSGKNTIVGSYDKVQKMTTERLLMELWSERSGGGTDFEKPLAYAAETIKKKEDILFITDGECHYPKWHEFWKLGNKKGLRLFVLQIGGMKLQDFPNASLAVHVPDGLSLAEVEKRISEFGKLMK